MWVTSKSSFVKLQHGNPPVVRPWNLGSGASVPWSLPPQTKTFKDPMSRLKTHHVFHQFTHQHA